MLPDVILNAPRTPAIYMIVNVSNGDFYIGSTKDLRARWADHWHELQRGCNKCGHLQHAWNLYTADAFEFRLLEPVASAAMLTMREQFYLTALEPPYNIRKIADRNTGLPLSAERREQIRQFMLTRPPRKHTPEEREHLSLLYKARGGLTPKQREALAQRRGRRYPTSGAKIAEKLRGQVISEEARKKQSESLRATLASPEKREQRRQQMLARWAKHHSGEQPMNLKNSPEARQRRSEAFKTNPAMVARAKALAEANRGRTPTAEHREKIRAAKLGRTHSAEHREKNSQARRAWWAARREAESAVTDEGTVDALPDPPTI